MRRSGPIKRGKPLVDGKIRKYHTIKRGAFSQLKKRKPMKQRSAKRVKEEKEYSRLRKEFLKANPICQVCREKEGVGMWMLATQVHHRGRRTGKWLLATKFWLGTCAHHHRQIEGEGEWARQNGYLLTIAQRRAISVQGGP
jgi:hypothetical protein